ncbi:type III ribulose-bisphosphate carboxylase [Candidatus Woesearchaeota archaeon]|uniref:Ribulose bisphosphate carboxylase n=1 Tax=uncultured Candidatus Woesearchaeota archaeon TaxID=2014372 RepID=A0A447IUG4_9ARCH|nr:type III ribulose-bisphosphate carboxylase [Candidatus Woesearchaeota archaeon]VDS11152.1 RuBisCO long chain, Form III-b [uncultured Candidatus Woesearchaeota archaeon]
MAGYEDFVHLDYKPKKTDLIASFHVKAPAWSTMKRSCGAVASESSVGTWAASVTGLKYEHVQKVAGKVFHIGNDGWIKIAYPQDHFEMGNMSQILASIAGNIFGMKAVESLRLQDIQWPEKIKKSFPGPQFGISGIRKIFGVKKRPLMLSVAKPKVGMTTKEHCEIGRQIWTGGLDLLKDDENLTGQKFNPFERRVTEALRIRNNVERKTGEKKSYLINVTHSRYKEMERRAKFVAKHGGEYVMLDIVTAGWQATHSLRELCGDLGLAIHAHRAFHGAFTRNPEHGFSMLAVGECARLVGVDQLHIGTAGVGKLVGSKEEVITIQEHIAEEPQILHRNKYRVHLSDRTVKADPKLHTLDEDWGNMKPVFPVSSGGLHPTILPTVLDRLGIDVMLQIGGGIHGHPKGSYAGACAMRAAVEAYMDDISMEEAAKKSVPLKQALDFWGYTRPR